MSGMVGKAGVSNRPTVATTFHHQESVLLRKRTYGIFRGATFWTSTGDAEQLSQGARKGGSRNTQGQLVFGRQGHDLQLQVLQPPAFCITQAVVHGKKESPPRASPVPELESPTSVGCSQLWTLSGMLPSSTELSSLMARSTSTRGR